MLIKKKASVRNIAFLLCSMSFVATPIHHHHIIHEMDVTPVRLHHDTVDIKKYVTERISGDLKKAKRWGRWMANKVAGISHYAFDAIPFEFFTDHRAIDAVFQRLEEGAA